jgi:hypothetical protein
MVHSQAEQPNSFQAKQPEGTAGSESAGIEQQHALEPENIESRVQLAARAVTFHCHCHLCHRTHDQALRSKSSSL